MTEQESADTYLRLLEENKKLKASLEESSRMRSCLLDIGDQVANTVDTNAETSSSYLLGRYNEAKDILNIIADYGFDRTILENNS